MRFLIKFASRGRLTAFMRGIENILQTITTDNYLILVTADIDDPEMHSAIKLQSPWVKVIYNYSESKIHAINRDMHHAGEWDVLVNFSDDMSFQVKGWNEIMEQKIKEVWGESTDFFAHWNDGYLGDKLPTMSIMGRKYYERDNYIYYPGYKSFSCDAEALYVSQMRQRWHYFPQILFMHQHPANVPSKVFNDETYRINSLATDSDTALYWDRLHNYFNEPHDETTPIPFKQHFKR